MCEKLKMKNIILFIFVVALFSLSSFAEVDIDKLDGKTFVSNCTQTQINGFSGYVIEDYTFIQHEQQFLFGRTWFKDSSCSGEIVKTEGHIGEFEIREEFLNGGFNPKGTYKIDFSTENGADKGLIYLNSGYSVLRISRGLVGGNRNTMLGLFEFKLLQ